MRFLTVLPAIFVAGSASADPGHLAETFGHSHWVAGIAIGVAAATALWGALKGRDSGAAGAAAHADASQDA